MGWLDFLRFWHHKEAPAVFSGPTSFEPVHHSLHRLATSKRIPGMSMSVSRNGDRLFEVAYGYADVDLQKPVEPQSVFRAASASKPIAATALLAMARAGEIDLDSSFYDYVPNFPRKKYPFTIRQLAAHTAGIRSYRGREFALNRPYTIRESIEFFKDDELLFKPGTGYHYNSLDWVLVSLAMEEASGIPFYDYVKTRVLDPLGMEATRPEFPGEPGKMEVEKYSRWKGGFKKATPVDNRYKLAGGGFLTTARDLCSLGAAYLDGRIPNDSLTREFLSPVEVAGRSTYYGLGWEVSSDSWGRPYFGHTGNGIGGYSNFYVYPKEGVVIASLINCTDPKVKPSLDAIYNQIFATF